MTAGRARARKFPPTRNATSRGQDLVDEQNVTVGVAPELEFRVGDDDAAGKRVVSGGL
jgi:hypothetical protein